MSSPVLTLEINDQVYDPSHFEQRCAAFARLGHLRRCAGRRIAACLSDPAEWLALAFYLREQGASVAPLHPNTPLEAARRAARRMRCETLLFEHVEAAVTLDEVHPPKSQVPALLQMSSGTTGEPKCVERTWDSVDEEVIAHGRALGPHAGLSPLLACPITHSYGLISGVLSSLARGLRPTVLVNINPKYVIRRALESDGRLLYASPTLLNVVTRLLSEQRAPCAVMTSGAPLPALWFNELRDRFRQVLQQYGCSEVGCISLATSPEAANEVGVPLGHLQVSAGKDAQSAEEIRVRAGGREVLTRDLGFLNGRGLHFLGRMDDTINVAGVNVYPLEVEEVLLEFPGLLEAVVHKRADPYAGERVCARFVARGQIELDALRRHCVARLNPFSVPLEMRQVDEIPRLENGKVDRRRFASVESAARAEGIS
jgi:acyl-coenzyme A synthetase/AMP-(fatty) acid ligase